MKKAVVVSLINEHERRKHIDDLFNEHSINFSYFDAINKDQVENTLKKYGLAVTSERISKGEVACYLSHYCLWEQVVKHEMPYLMVFEDDVYFSKEANDLLNSSEWLPSEFDVIKLETMHGRVLVNKGTNLTSDHKLCRMKSSHMGMAGYIVSRKGAQKLVKMTRELGVDRPVDHIMFDKLIEQKTSNVYQVSPALCIQDKIYNEQSTRFESCLEEERQSRPVVKVKLSAQQKINRELTRLWTQMNLANLSRSLLLTINGYKRQEIEYKE
ncbi:glycosyltransferase family 25 protein [Psychrobacter sp. 1U1]|uniref:glycosyltransferase family 25 protein n=1 Tax=Psychrobacter sp. 1U1 TaxID=3453576 RepID=UPI003F474A95